MLQIFFSLSLSAVWTVFGPSLLAALRSTLEPSESTVAELSRFVDNKPGTTRNLHCNPS